MANEIKKMSPQKFRELGYLRELNRRFLHPLGLALEVIIDNKDNVSFGNIHDCRDDPEGFYYCDAVINQSKTKKQAERIDAELEARRKAREKLFGSMIQPIPDVKN